jgi:hypothetical protein
LAPFLEDAFAAEPLAVAFAVDRAAVLPAVLLATLFAALLVDFVANLVATLVATSVLDRHVRSVIIRCVVPALFPGCDAPSPNRTL